MLSSLLFFNGYITERGFATLRLHREEQRFLNKNMGSNGIDGMRKLLKRAYKPINGTPIKTIAATFTPMSDVAQPVALAA